MRNYEIKDYVLIGESPKGYSCYSGKKFTIELANDRECTFHSTDGKINFKTDPESVFIETYSFIYQDYPDKTLDSELKHDFLYRKKVFKKTKRPQAIPIWLLKLREN